MAISRVAGLAVSVSEERIADYTIEEMEGIDEMEGRFEGFSDGCALMLGC